MKNFGLLKLGLMQHGVYIPSEVRALQEVARGLFSGKTKTEITFAFCEDFFVRTFSNTGNKNFAKMQIHEGRILLCSEEESVEVSIIPPPMFLQKRLQSRDPVFHNIDLDGNCLNLFLCAEKGSGGINISHENVISIIRAAFEEGVADLVQLNLDYREEDDRGFSRLAPLIGEIKKKFSTFVSLRGFPPKDKSVIDSIYASGVDLLNYPLEGFAGSQTLETTEVLQQIRDALEYAVEIFPQGAVSTELVLGSVQQLKRNIDGLTAKGIIPRIKLDVRHGKGSRERAQVTAAARHLTNAAQRDKLNLKWLYPTCYFVTPLDAAFFTEDPKSARLAVRPVYRSKLGRVALEGFAALRRKLRVKNISDSFESAGL